MGRAPLRDPDAHRRLDATLAAWAKGWRGNALVGPVEHRDEPDDRGHFHWLVRLRGDEKPVITIWLSLRQRSVFVETEVVPAPETSAEALYRFLLAKNHDLFEAHLAIGPEAGIYLVSRVPLAELNLERLDELVGAVVTHVDEVYPTAMSIGLPGLYRRPAR